MSLDGAHHANEPSLFDESAVDDYVGTPWLSGFIFFASAIGTFVGAWAVVFLFGQRHHGFGDWWPLVLILALDLGINVALRLVRRRRRRALGLMKPRRGHG